MGGRRYSKRRPAGEAEEEGIRLARWDARCVSAGAWWGKTHGACVVSRTGRAPVAAEGRRLWACHLAWALLCSVSVQKQHESWRRGQLTMAVNRTISLNPTPAGAAIDATGRIEVRARGSEQHFEVGIDAALADGATFTVIANGRPAGTMALASGAGNLHLHNLAGNLPPGVDPVCHLQTVEIRDSDGNVVLEKARLFSDSAAAP